MILANKPSFMLAPDGSPMAVIRPEDPALALRLAKECLDPSRTAAENSKAFNEILQAQPYRYVGLCESSATPEQKPRILDHDGCVVGHLQPGDSFVSSSVLEVPSQVQS